MDAEEVLLETNRSRRVYIREDWKQGIMECEDCRKVSTSAQLEVIGNK